MLYFVGDLTGARGIDRYVSFFTTGLSAKCDAFLTERNGKDLLNEQKRESFTDNLEKEL